MIEDRKAWKKRERKIEELKEKRKHRARENEGKKIWRECIKSGDTV